MPGPAALGTRAVPGSADRDHAERPDEGRMPPPVLPSASMPRRPSSVAPPARRAPGALASVVALALAASLALAACGSSAVASAVPAGGSSPPGGATSAPTAEARSAAASPLVTEAPPTGLDATRFGSPAPPVQIDDALADLLPATVDGIAVERSAETESAALTSPTLGADADGFAAVQVATPDLADLAIASIVHLKASTDADTFFADWRPGFDEAVCAPAGGVSTTEVRTIGERSVDTTLCVEGARVYHVRLDRGRTLLSILDVGTKGFGQGLIEGLGD